MVARPPSRQWLLVGGATAVVLALVVGVLVYRSMTAVWVADSSYRFDPCSLLTNEDLSPVAEASSDDSGMISSEHTLIRWGANTIADRCGYGSNNEPGLEFVSMAIGKAGSADDDQLGWTGSLDIGDRSRIFTGESEVRILTEISGLDILLTARSIVVGESAQVLRDPLIYVARQAVRAVPADFKTPALMASGECEQISDDRIDSALGSPAVISRSLDEEKSRKKFCSFAGPGGRIVNMTLSSGLSENRLSTLRKNSIQLRRGGNVEIFRGGEKSAMLVDEESSSSLTMSWTDPVAQPLHVDNGKLVDENAADELIQFGVYALSSLR